MSIKQIVNNHDLYLSLLAEFELMLDAERKSLEKVTDVHQMYQAQGAIRTLRRLMTLREIVNGRKSA